MTGSLETLYGGPLDGLEEEAWKLEGLPKAKFPMVIKESKTGGRCWWPADKSDAKPVAHYQWKEHRWVYSHQAPA